MVLCLAPARWAGAAEAPSAETPVAGGAGKVSEILQEQSAAKGRSWLRQVFGPGMVPLWICSVALIALILERRKSLRPDRILNPAMVERVADLVGELKVPEARKVSDDSPTVVGQAWARGFHEFSLGGMALAESLTNSTVLAFKPLKRNLGAIATIGVISPLLGLLGTVLGMIITFNQIAATGGADKTKLAGGIGLALFTTAGGLIVAIPAILSGRWFTGRLTRIAEQTEEAISRINYRHSHATARRQQDETDAAAPAETPAASGEEAP